MGLTGSVMELGPPNPGMPVSKPVCSDALMHTCMHTHTHTHTHLTYFGHQIYVDTLGLPAGTLHVEGGAAGPRVAPRTCRTQELTQGA